MADPASLALKQERREAALARMNTLPELRNYQADPLQMKAGARGKVGILELVFESKRNNSVLTHVYRVAPLLVQQGLYFDESWPELPIVPIISVGGGTLQGDRYAIDIEVKDNAIASVTSQSATRIQEMNTNYATQFQAISVGKHAYLEYIPDTTILYKNARYACLNEVTVDETGVFIYGETVMLGRKHYKNERYDFALFSTQLTVYRPAKNHTEEGEKQCVFSEKMLITQEDPIKGFNLVMKNYDVFSNLVCVLPETYIKPLLDSYPFRWNKELALMAGLSTLPNQSGLILRVVGKESYHVQDEIKRFTQLVRELVKPNLYKNT